MARTRRQVGNGRGLVRAEGLHFDEAGAHFNLVVEGQGQTPVTMDVAGRHMVNNALLAAGAGMALGLALEEISAGLQSAEITGGRLKKFDAGGITVFDDTYNANPDSVKAAIEVRYWEIRKRVMQCCGTFSCSGRRRRFWLKSPMNVRLLNGGVLRRSVMCLPTVTSASTTIFSGM